MLKLKYKYLLLVGVLVSPLLYAMDWNYSGTTGPQHWAQLNPAYKLCATGLEQSPIDIPATALLAKTQSLQVHYDLDREVLEEARSSIKMFPYQQKNLWLADANHETIEVMLAKPSGHNELIWQHKSYHLIQFHFHIPSENHMAGQVFPLEIHFVNQAKDGTLAVVAAFFKVGHANAALAKILAAVPTTTSEVNILPWHDLNVQALLPSNRSFYHFKGSLTTPPCSEGVQWFVMQQPVELSAQQLERFMQVLPIKNARPIQNTHERTITFSGF